MRNQQAHQSAREQREQARRDAAADKAERLRRQVPKEDRQAAKRMKREEKYRDSFEFDVEAEPQMGGIIDALTVAKNVGTTAAGFIVARAAVNALGAIRDAALSTSGLARTARRSSVLLGRAAERWGSPNEVSQALAGPVVRALESLKSTLVTNVGQALWRIPLVAIVWWLCNRCGLGSTPAKIVCVCAAGIIGNEIWSHISEHFLTAGESAVPQSGDGVGQLSRVVATAMAFCVFGKNGKLRLADVMKNMAFWQKSSDGLSGMLTWVLESVQGIVNWIRAKFGKERLSFISRHKEPLRALEREVDQMENDYRTGEMDSSNDMVDRVRDAMVRCSGFREVYRGTTVMPVLDRMLQRLNCMMAPMYGILSSRKNFRVEPVFVLLNGESGIGKTAFTAAMGVHVMKAAGLVPEGADWDACIRQVYSPGNSPYWEGYANQKVLVLDDIFQAEPTPQDKENDYLTIIRMVGSWAMSLNMATLESKGRVYFDSPVVLGTTNQTNLAHAAKVVTYPAAVVRRVRHGYRIELKPEYATGGRLMAEDYEAECLKCKGGTGLSAYPWYMWRALKWNYEHGVPCVADDYISMEELLSLVVASVNQNAEHHKLYKSSIAAIISPHPVSSPAPVSPSVPVGSEIEDDPSELELVPQSGRAVGSANAAAPRMLEAYLDASRPLSPFETDAGIIKRWVDARLVHQDKHGYLAAAPDLVEAVSACLDSDHPDDVALGHVLAGVLVRHYDSRLDPELRLNACLMWLRSIGPDHPLHPEYVRRDWRRALHPVARRALRAREAGAGLLRHLGRLAASVGNSLTSIAGVAGQKLVTAWQALMQMEAEDFGRVSVIVTGASLVLLAAYLVLVPFVRGIVNFVRGLFGLQPIKLARTKIGDVSIVSHDTDEGRAAQVMKILEKLGVSDEQKRRAKQELGLELEPLSEDECVVEAMPQSNLPHRAKPGKYRAGELASPQSANTAIHDNVYNNTYKVIYKKGGNTCHLGQILFVKGDVFIAPRHFADNILREIDLGELQDTDELSLHSAKTGAQVVVTTCGAFSRLTRVVTSNSDLCLARFTDSIRAHKDLTSKFLLNKDIIKCSGKPARLDVCTASMTGGELGLVHHVHNIAGVSIARNVRSAGYELKETWSYSAVTSEGDCGAPLMLWDNATMPHARTVMGIHVAGAFPVAGTLSSTRRGYAAIVTQETLQTCLDKLKSATGYEPEEDVSEEDLELIVQSGGVPLDLVPEELRDQVPTLPDLQVMPVDALPWSTAPECSFVPLWELSKGNNFSPASRYRLTDVGFEEPFGPCPVRPAVLGTTRRHGVLVHPLEQSYANYSTVVQYFDGEILGKAFRTALYPFMKCTMDSPRHILDFDTAVVGDPVLGMRSIPRDTSAGWPLSQVYKGGKRAIFGQHDAYDLTTVPCQLLRLRCDYIIAMAKQGKRCLHVCSDFPKDELLLHEKVESVRTRLISGTGLAYYIVCRMYFGAFVQAQLTHWEESGMCPGICVYSDWGLLVSKLSAKGDKCFDGDFKRFDASQQPCLLGKILPLINEWYADGPVNARVREILWLDLIHSRHLGGVGHDQRFIIQWHKSLPSGHFLTSCVNSIFSMFCLTYSFIRATGMSDEFHDHVSAATLGDDNVANISDFIAPVYNQLVVSKHVKELGLDYTAGRKGAELVEHMPLTECTFLRRAFSSEDTRTLCPIALDSFLYITYWTKKRTVEEIRSVMIDNWEYALEELSMHRAAEWDKYAPAILNLMARYQHVPLQQPTRLGYQKAVLARTTNWW
jgi:hypothetical protein